MKKFFKFKTACFSAENANLLEEEETLGLNVDPMSKLEYKDLPIRVSSIIFYFPIKSLVIGSKNPKDILPDDEVWFDAQYINVTLIDGTELTVNMNIQDFEKVLNDYDK